VSSVEPSPEPISGQAPTAAVHRDSFSDVDSELGLLVRELAAPPPREEPEREPDRVLEPGTLIANHFEVVRKLGMGGMGVVYLAHDMRLDRVVAIKLLAPRRSEAGTRREAGTARLEREAQAMAQLAHPNVVTVHEVGRHDDGVYVAMEFVDGGTARQWLNERVRSVAEIVELYLQAARGLAAAHAAGFVHRDFKPDNVLVGRDDRVRVADFGLARTWASGEHSIVDPPSGPIYSESRSRPSIPQLTATDAVVGTPGYMAPEQFSGRELGPAIDQFAFGIALFEALWNERPYGALASWVATAADLRVPARGPAGRVPGWLRELVLRTIELEPRRRFPSMQALVVGLERGRLRSRRRAIALVATTTFGVAVAAGIGVGSSARADPCSDAEPIAAALWNQGFRDAIAGSVASDDPLTQRTWSVAEPMIDDWVVRWTEDRRESCIATRVHGSQSEQLLDRSVACLDVRLAELRTLLEVLASEPRARANADTHAAGLRETSSCRDRSYLLALVEPPTDPTVREEADRIAGELRRIRLGLDDEQYDDPEGRLQLLAEDAQRTAYAPVIATVEIEIGRVALAHDQREEAGRRWRGAYFIARRASDDETADSAAVLLAFLAGSIGSDRATAEIWLDHIAADLQRGTGSLDLEVALEATRCQVFQRAGAHIEAIAAARTALAAASAGTPMPVRLLTVRGELAAALDDAGHHREAIAEYDTLLADTEALYGVDHPRVAMVLTNRGLAHYYIQHNDLAVADQQRALAIHLAHDGPSGETAGVLLNLGLAHVALGQLDQAQSPIEQALAIWRRIDAKTEQALALNALGWIELERGNRGRALAHHREALAIDQALLPAGHPELADDWQRIGDTQLALGDTLAAIDSYLQARAVWEQPELRGHPGRAGPELGLARAYLALDRLDDAQRNADDVLELGKHAEVEPAILVGARFVGAQVADRRGDRELAVSEARTALAAASSMQGDRIGEEIAAFLRERDAG
jgi:eukaryotic-like serine/threonine-protein kinase